MKKTFPQVFTWGFLICAELPRLGAQGLWLEAGPAVRGGMQVKLSGSSYVQQLGLHAVPVPLNDPASVGNQTSFADRIYQDGYVKLDPGTTDPNSVGGAGNTWNWGYDNATQYNAAGNSLSFRQQGDPGFTTLQNNSASGKDDALAAGLQLNAGFRVWESGKWSVDLMGGFQGTWGSRVNLSMSSYGEKVSRVTVTDGYNVAGAVDPALGFPPARTSPGGYTGTFDGPFGGPSTWAGGYPVIPNTPASRTRAVEDLSTVRNLISVHVDSDFYEFTVGPRLRYAATEKFSLHASPSVGIGYLDVSADRSEVFVQTATGGGSTLLGSWTDHQDKTGIRFTTGLTAGADWDLGNGFYTGVAGGYDWVVGATRLNLGPNTVSMDGSGFVGRMVVGKRF
jgi:hypothetical protein